MGSLAWVVDEVRGLPGRPQGKAHQAEGQVQMKEKSGRDQQASHLAEHVVPGGEEGNWARTQRPVCPAYSLGDAGEC